MVFDLIANSFWATLLLFSALIYAIFAQAVTGAKLYRDHARQYQVIASSSRARYCERSWRDEVMGAGCARGSCRREPWHSLCG